MTKNDDQQTGYRPEIAHLDLGGEFFSPVTAAGFPEAILRYRNDRAAAYIGLNQLSDASWIDHFGRFATLPDNMTEPLALKYHGHQFQSYNPNIGDGRGFLFAQLRDNAGRLLDLGTKGSGQTPFSRQGDGRLTLKGGVREILATEMLEALGVYTSKTFSLIETGEALERHDEPSPTRSAVLVRLSHSHVRFGTFQYLAYHGRHDDILRLIDHCIEYYFPHLRNLGAEDKVLGFFKEVILRSGWLVGSWMAAGFVHGVLNTDNMNITGESFDYGPWRFLPEVQPGFTAAYFDHNKIYAYGRQPEAVGWNIAQLGGTLVQLVEEEKLNEALKGYAGAYETAMAAHFARRLGVQELDVAFVGKLLRWMHDSNAPFEQVLFDWFCGSASAARAAHSPITDLYQNEEWQPLQSVLLDAEPVQRERLDHAYFSGRQPCTMLIEEMEALWEPIHENDDWSALTAKLESIAQMREAYGFEATPSLLSNSALGKMSS